MPCANQILYPASGQISQTGPQIPRSPEPASAFKNVDISPKCSTLRSQYAQLRFSGRDMNIKKLEDDLVICLLLLRVHHLSEPKVSAYLWNFHRDVNEEVTEMFCQTFQ